jgi:hypothetical protein
MKYYIHLYETLFVENEHHSDNHYKDFLKKVNLTRLEPGSLLAPYFMDVTEFCGYSHFGPSAWLCSPFPDPMRTGFPVL